MINNELPKSLSDLATANMRSIETYSYMPDIASHPDCVDAGSVYMNNRFAHIDKAQPLDENTVATEIVKAFDSTFILVRPEMYHNTGAIADYLQDRNFTIHYVSDRIVTPETYYQMYGSVFAEDEAKAAWPTRTIVYLDSPASIICFTDKTNRFVNTSLADGFTKHCKGKGGVRNLSTIRGSVVFDEAMRLGFNTLENEIVAEALDPIHAYRHIVADTSPNQPHSHLAYEIALLNYVAVSVHSPDRSEIVRDLMALNTNNQLHEIYDSLRA